MRIFQGKWSKIMYFPRNKIRERRRSKQTFSGEKKKKIITEIVGILLLKNGVKLKIFQGTKSERNAEIIDILQTFFGKIKRINL